MSKTINVIGTEVSYHSRQNEEYLSLTDIAKYKNPEAPRDIIKNWLRNRSTIEFIGLWEIINNPDFKQVEFDLFKNEAGSNSFCLQASGSIVLAQLVLVLNQADMEELMLIKI